MTDAPTLAVGGHRPWLSQGDIFKKLPVVNAGLRDGAPASALEQAPAMLISHGCAIDKKNNQGQSVLEWLTFLPLQDVAALEADRVRNLRSNATNLTPYNVIYIGQVPEVGECYAMLNRPYTLPAALLNPVLRDFDGSETGEGEDRRIVNQSWTTRVACMTPETVRLFQRKWNALWTQTFPPD